MAKRASQPNTPLDAQVRIAILHGKEAFLRSEYTAQLRRALEEAHGGLDVIKLDGSEVEPVDVLDEARSFGLLAQHKLVVVDQALDLLNEQSRPMFERYAEAPAEGATLVLRSETWRPGKLDKAVAKVGVVMKCDHIADHQAVNWVCKRAESKHAGSIERAAAQRLVERIGADLVRLDSELGKLVSSAGGVITEQHVRELVGQSREEQVWGIQADLLSRDPSVALGRLREAIDVSRHPPVLISYAMVDLARKMSAISRAIERGDNPQATAKAVKLWGPAQDAVTRAARALGTRETGALLVEAVEADAGQKSGRGDPERLLERLALRFATLGR